jgi:hypothetical protein
LAPPQHLTLGGNVRLILPGGMQAFLKRSASAGAEIDEGLPNQSFRRKRACTTVSDYSWVKPARLHDSADRMKP